MMREEGNEDGRSTLTRVHDIAATGLESSAHASVATGIPVLAVMLLFGEVPK
jgi:hypothetical protein